MKLLEREQTEQFVDESKASDWPLTTESLVKIMRSENPSFQYLELSQQQLYWTRHHIEGSQRINKLPELRHIRIIAAYEQLLSDEDRAWIDNDPTDKRAVLISEQGIKRA